MNNLQDITQDRLVRPIHPGEVIADILDDLDINPSNFAEILGISNQTIQEIINYRGALRRLQPERVLYLAVPLTTYKTFFQLDFPKNMILENQLKMLVYDVEQEVIFKWIH